jgi:hypothetical protein
VDAVGRAVGVRHQQRGAVAAHSDAGTPRLHTERGYDAARNAAQTTAEEASDGAAVHAAQRPRHAVATAQHRDAPQWIARRRRDAATVAAVGGGGSGTAAPSATAQQDRSHSRRTGVDDSGQEASARVASRGSVQRRGGQNVDPLSTVASCPQRRLSVWHCDSPTAPSV